MNTEAHVAVRLWGPEPSICGAIMAMRKMLQAEFPEVSMKNLDWKPEGMDIGGEE